MSCADLPDDPTPSKAAGVTNPASHVPTTLGNIPIVAESELDQLQASGVKVMEVQLDAQGNVEGLKERKIGTRKVKAQTTEDSEEEQAAEGDESSEASDTDEGESDDSTDGATKAFGQVNAAAVMRAMESLKKTLEGNAMENTGQIKELLKGYNIENVQAFTLGEDGETR